ncbi:outer membrane immunogenic protein [Afipia massiliensis]|uniref:Outer membrane immunogenic protein n=1 Tax=Afipia massiliensis TaxID=211460 RepID=A0A840MZE6_9BRAD|nr:outer membrane protein [Afipia massiliensis]MBB5051088.1 outer membrane immunogenic protein [Afipia massiliensis]
MRNILIAASVVTALSTGVASAADIAAKPYVKAPPIVQVYNWTGFYVGAHVGGGWGNKDWEFYRTSVGPLVPPTFTSHNVNGALAGGQFGYNYQVGAWVFGIEGEGSWADLKGDSACPNPAANCSTKVEWMASIAGRLGYAWDNVLLYVKGGGAWAGERHDISFAALPAGNETTGDVTRSGYTIGAGLEYGFTPNWTAKLEYMYSDFGNRSVDFTRIATGAFVESARVDQQIHTLKLGVNYRFGWGGPVVAKN